jgi:hypothetical protein
MSESEKILTNAKKNTILKLTIREFRNNFSRYRHLAEEGMVIVVYNRKKPILLVSAFHDNVVLDS